VQAMLSFGTQINKNAFCIHQHISYEKAEPNSASHNFNAGEFGPLIAEVKNKVACSLSTQLK